MSAQALLYLQSVERNHSLGNACPFRPRLLALCIFVTMLPNQLAHRQALIVQASRMRSMLTIRFSI